jgi:transcription-repair coupling factor (superfamily II helicase)
MLDELITFVVSSTSITDELTRIGGIDSNSLIIASTFIKKQNTIFLVTSSLDDCQKYYSKIRQILPNDTYLFPCDQTFSFLMSINSIEFRIERIYTLYSLIEKQKGIVVTTKDGLSQYLLSKQDYLASTKTYHEGQEYDISSIIKLLVINGYKNNYLVSNIGDYSLKGSILDIYLPNYENPVRFDFFGSNLESIRFFSPSDQKTINKINYVKIIPLFDLFYNEEIKNVAIDKITEFRNKYDLSKLEKAKLDDDINHIKEKTNLSSLALYTSFFTSNLYTITDFVSDYDVFLVNLNKLKSYENEISSEIEAFDITLKGDRLSKIPFRKPLSEIIDKPFNELKEDISLEYSPYLDFRSLIDYFIVQLKTSKFETIIVSDLSEELELELIEKLKSSNFSFDNEFTLKPGIHIVSCLIPFNIAFVKNKLLIINSLVFTNKLESYSNYRSVIYQGKKINSVDELKEGDYVVHFDYGIGKFKCISTMDFSGYKKDYLELEYSGSELLYVPIEQIDLVLKYGNADGVAPSLNKLGSKSWSRAKSETKIKIKELGDELLKLYALRSLEQGYSFTYDPKAQQKINSTFFYKETADQQKAIDSTLLDMQKETPMDRVIIGDVGFGKTEVALRATYLSFQSLKQVAYLVPTTVLARQHYLNFKKRLEPLGLKVRLLSRLQNPSEIKQILFDLELGEIDVVIGTHRLLSDDVIFSDLGLLIIDEEQRFGVMQKEKIKKLKLNIDCLSLTATPIPRTLQQVNMGIKQYSLIETPPENRYAVQTYLIERNELIIKDAIEKEISRGGQVFYLFNKVDQIEEIALHLRNLVSNCKVEFIHGQMNKQQIENTLTNFIDKKFDCLVATTIIETGIDIPNANTLLVHDATVLGLAQLYQIRGRVGRSNKISYCYLMYGKNKMLTSEAKERLIAITEFTELGSGYKLAMKDLEIRGSGNILGSEQSGYIATVGLNLYLKLLKDQMDKTDTFALIKKKSDRQTIYSNRSIDSNYISNESTKIEMHRKVSNVFSLEDVSNLILEFTDRFGKPDKLLIDYIYESLLINLCEELGIKSYSKSIVHFDLELNNNSPITFDSLVTLHEKYKNIHPKVSYSKTILIIEIKSTIWLSEVCQILYDLSLLIKPLNLEAK